MTSSMTASTAEASAPSSTVADSSTARRAMIDSQLRVSGVNDTAVLAAISQIPREDYLPAEARGHAYIDRAIPLGQGRALPAPLVQGMMLSEALPRPGERVLVVTAGSTYLAALVGAMGALVDSVDAAAVAKAKRSAAPYDLVLIDGAIEHLPGALADALAEGGRVVTGLVLRGVTRLASGRKLGDKVQLLPLAEVGIPVLGDFARAKTWSF